MTPAMGRYLAKSTPFNGVDVLPAGFGDYKNKRESQMRNRAILLFSLSISTRRWSLPKLASLLHPKRITRVSAATRGCFGCDRLGGSP
uniref:Uncharacterized protein n=1 Tax=Picea glauca TaxID=3330 RepID=A0A101LW03_PICGL|nr:hypothetical protein ABT39_MTgene1989 [Picea glauca]QHR87473.1 hypothetical protein Q903MT_gene1484 [Picea sitchensis]